MFGHINPEILANNRDDQAPTFHPESCYYPLLVPIDSFNRLNN